MWKKMYMILLDGIAKSIETLQAASIEAERFYISADDTPPISLESAKSHLTEEEYQNDCKSNDS